MELYIIVAVIVVVAAIILYKRKKGEKEVPQGLQVFDEDGNMIVDVTDRLSKYLGKFDTGFEDGSITNDMLTEGNLWIVFVGYQYSSHEVWNDELHPPTFTVNGSVLSWTFPNSRYRVRFIGYYGVY